MTSNLTVDVRVGVVAVICSEGAEIDAVLLESPDINDLAEIAEQVTAQARGLA
jgi:hypothetical protein